MRTSGRTSRRTELARAQRLYMHLLYSQEAAAAFEQAPESLLAEHGLDVTWQRLLPDTRSEGHRAEMHGRRVRAVDELKDIYAATFRHLIGEPYSEARILGAGWFTEFLSSEEFFEPRWSLPHPTGVGRGYEGGTRFFFWARRHFRLRERDADPVLRGELYLDFSALVDEMRRGARPRAWRRFAHGLYWRERPGRVRDITVYTPDRQVLHTGGQAAVAALHDMGLMDLDELQP